MGDTLETDIFPYGRKSLLAGLINEKYSILISKFKTNIFPVDFCTRNFLGRWGGGVGRAGYVSPYTANPLNVALSPFHNDISIFRPRPPIATGNNYVFPRKISKFAQTSGTIDGFDQRSGISGPTSRCYFARPALHELCTQPTHVRCPVAQLLI